MIVASDLNGTLTTGAPILAVANWADQQYKIDLRPKYFKYRVLLSYLSVKIGLVDTHTWADIYLRKVLELITSPTLEKLDQAMRFVVDDELWPKKKPEAVKFLRDLHQQGAEIILVSAAFEPAVIHFGNKIAQDEVTGIGTPVFLDKGKLYLAKDLTVENRKMALLQEKLGKRKLDYALGDSIKDLPMLEGAVNPIAVSPDKHLRSIAVDRRWRIIE
jgi:phosphoserine phosphatase